MAKDHRWSSGSGYAPPEARQLGALQQRDPCHHHVQHQKKGRQEPPSPPKPEVAESKVAEGVSLPEEQVGYQVTTESEEHAHSEQPPLGPAQLQVVGDDGKHRNGPQPVEPGHVALGTSYRLRQDAPPRCRRRSTASWHASRPAAQTSRLPVAGTVRPCRTAGRCPPRLVSACPGRAA